MNKNLKIVISSIMLTILSMVVLELLLSFINGIGIGIPNDSVMGNVLLEVSILVAQVLVIRIYFKEIKAYALGLNNKYIVKPISYGVLIGLVLTVFVYVIFFVLKIGNFKGFGFLFYPINMVVVYVIGMFFRALFAGFCEEVFFRGVLLNYFSKYKGKLAGLLLSSIIFMVFHCLRYNSIAQLLSVFLGGLALGAIYLVTDSLYVSIGLHFATDFFMNLVNLRTQPSLFVFDINPKYNMAQLDEYSFRLFAVAYFILLIILLIKRAATSNS